MKEVELTGETIDEVFEKLKAHVGQKICQYSDNDRFESTLIKVSHMDDVHIFIDTDPYGIYDYYHGVAAPLFLCIEKNETFDEMVQRKQREMFKEKCY